MHLNDDKPHWCQLKLCVAEDAKGRRTCVRAVPMVVCSSFCFIASDESRSGTVLATIQVV